MDVMMSSLDLLAQTAPPTPLLPEISRDQIQAWAPVVAGILVCLAGLVGILYGTRLGIIARATVKESVRQPIFLIVLSLSMLMLVANTFVPFFTFGEDYKVTEDCGLKIILFSGLLLAVWTSSTSVADEIEGKTAMTLLSKPINRRQFIGGKYVGILTSSLLVMLPQTLILVGLLYYKFRFYDPRESSRDDVTTAMAIAELLRLLPGVLLAYMEISVLSAISVAISTRVPMVVNFATCLTLFVVGHLTPSLVGQSVQGLELVLFMARFIAALMPALSIYNIDDALIQNTTAPPEYIGLAAVYTACYVGGAVLLSFILFEDRDLA